MNSVPHIAIIGAGAWGTALATVLVENNHRVKLWCFDPLDAQNITDHRQNSRYLPGVQLDKKITAVTDLQEALSGALWVIEAVPVQHLRSILIDMKPYITEEQTLIISSKGIEQETLLLPSEIINSVFSPLRVQQAVISGPSFARDLAAKKITGITIASNCREIATKVQQLITTNYLICDLSTDVIGVQAGGALKNIIAVGMGILDGAGYGQNTSAYFLTRGLQEIALLAQALGSCSETLYGLSGIGDLVLTAMGSQSRNRAVGKEIGQGKSLQDILVQTGFIPEGINSVQSAYQLMNRKKLRLPIMRGIYEVIFLQKDSDAFVRDCIR